MGAGSVLPSTCEGALARSTCAKSVLVAFVFEHLDPSVPVQVCSALGYTTRPTTRNFCRVACLFEEQVRCAAIP